MRLKGGRNLYFRGRKLLLQFAGFDLKRQEVFMQILNLFTPFLQKKIKHYVLVNQYEG